MKYVVSAIGLITATVEEIDMNSLKIKDQFIAIGGTYRDEVHKRIDGYKLR